MDSTSASSSDAGDQITVTAPTGIQDGDFLIGSANVEGQPIAEIWATPSGFTLIDSNNDQTGRDRSHGLWYKIASGESGDYTFEIEGTTSGEDRSACISVYRGVDNTTPLDVAYVEANHYSDFSNTPTPTPDAITTNTDGAFVIVTSAIVPTVITSGIAPSGYTLVVDEKAVANLHLAYKEVANAGTETPGAWQHTGGAAGDESSTFTIALKPASVANIPPGLGPSLSEQGRSSPIVSVMSRW